MVTERIKFGTSIIPTWPRHPIAMAQQAVALSSLAPGRFRMGIGPSHEPAMVRMMNALESPPDTCASTSRFCRRCYARAASTSRASGLPRELRSLRPSTCP
jgi:alkanesulfonate monooxygenase SsuD/methylene tetrahydromethanopterin reductase-like flavin-dependent oxidoreductase (luciferase family)